MFKFISKLKEWKIKLDSMCSHCYHLQDAGVCRWKIRQKATGCNIDTNPFINKRGNVNYVMKEVCCKCGAAKMLWCEDFMPSRAMEYPEYIKE